MFLGFENLLLHTPVPVLGIILYQATPPSGVGATGKVWGKNHFPPTYAALILGLEAIFTRITSWMALGQSLLTILLTG